jgi:hypothetical protein
MAELDPVRAGVYQYLRGLDDDEFGELVMLARQPDITSQLKRFAAQYVPDEQQLESFLGVANVKAFEDAGGGFDESKAAGLLGRMFGPPRQRREWGQHGDTPVGYQAGDEGRAEALRRAATAPGHVAGGMETPAQLTVLGSAGRPEARKRRAAKEIGGATGE